MCFRKSLPYKEEYGDILLALRLVGLTKKEAMLHLRVVYPELNLSIFDLYKFHRIGVDS